MLQQTVSEFIDMWITLRSAGLAKSTISGYRGALRLHIAPVIGDMPLSAISAMDIMRCLSPLVSSGQTRCAQLVHITLRASLKDAVLMGLIPANPALAVKQPRHQTADIRFWTTEEISQFLTSQKDQPLYAVWLLALCCGLRRGELLGLRWSDFDFTSNVLHIRNQRIQIDRETIECAPKSRAGKRDLTLPQPLIDAILLYRTKKASLSPYVLSEDGKPFSAYQLRKALESACDSAGLPHLHIHGLRHSMATTAVSSGIDIKVLQTLLGHSHFSITADTYAHATDTIRANALARISHIMI